MCLPDFYFKTFSTLLQNRKLKLKTKKILNLSIINAEQHEEAKKVEKSGDVVEKNEDMRIQVEI